jgi:hypothetical protein
MTRKGGDVLKSIDTRRELTGFRINHNDTDPVSTTAFEL